MNATELYLEPKHIKAGLRVVTTDKYHFELRHKRYVVAKFIKYVGVGVDIRFQANRYLGEKNEGN